MSASTLGSVAATASASFRSRNSTSNSSGCTSATTSCIQGWQVVHTTSGFVSVTRRRYSIDPASLQYPATKLTKSATLSRQNEANVADTNGDTGAATLVWLTAASLLIRLWHHQVGGAAEASAHTNTYESEQACVSQNSPTLAREVSR